MRYLGTVAVSGLALAMAACSSANGDSSAATTNDSGMAMEVGNDTLTSNAMANAGGTTPGAPQSADAFVAAAAGSDMYEIESGKLAQGKLTNAALKTFAVMLVKDHTKSSADLKTAASSASPAITPPAALPAEQKAKIDALNAASGAEFERLFLQQQKEGHQTTLETLKAYAASGDQQSLKTFATNAVPVVQRHLDDLNKIKL